MANDPAFGCGGSTGTAPVDPPSTTRGCAQRALLSARDDAALMEDAGVGRGGPDEDSVFCVKNQAFCMRPRRDWVRY